MLPSTGHSKRPAPCEAKYSTRPRPKKPYQGPTMRRYCEPASIMAGSVLNSDSQAAGYAAAHRPMASVIANAIAAPIQVARKARSR